MAQDPIAAIRGDLAARRFRSARKKAQIGKKKFPRDPAFPALAAQALASDGDHGGAAQEFEQALRLDPGNLNLRCDLAMALIMSGRMEKADTVLQGVPEGSPAMARAHYMRAMIATRRADFRTAVAEADAALGAAPKMTEALNLRGIAFSELRRPETAISDFRKVLALQPANLRARENLADRLAEVGRFDEAIEEYRTLVRLDPAHGHALFRLSQLSDRESLGGLRDSVIAALKAGPRDPNHEALLHMAAGTLHARAGDDAEAVRHLDRAHTLDAKSRPWAGARGRDGFTHMARLFGSPPDPGASRPGPRPIFVVGMPRSGSTLVEMILTASGAVASCGELVTAERLYRDLVRPADRLTPELIDRYANEYLAALPDLPTDAVAFVDKMPANHAHLGLLLTAFPEARAIDIRRDPRDVAASMWMQRFTAEGMAYASDLRRIGEAANAYHRCMTLWGEHFPDRILTLAYEDLVRDLDPATRRLAEFCGIDWTPAMLAPEANAATVKTASLGQVREKVHARSIGRWSILGDRIRELTDALDPELWPDLS